MKNGEVLFEDPELDDFYERTDRIDGPKVHGFTPTLQELIQLVKFHTQEFVELHWDAFMNSLEISTVIADAIWTRLENIRRLVREDDFKRTVEVACIQFGMEVDSRIWDVFVHGDKGLRRATALEIQQSRNKSVLTFSEELSRQIDEVPQGQQEVPPEVLRRMEQPILSKKEQERRFIQ